MFDDRLTWKGSKLCNTTMLVSFHKSEILDQEIRERNSLAFVNESVGKDTPKKKPNIIPTKVVIISLIVSFVLLMCQMLLKQEIPSSLMYYYIQLV